MVARTRYSLPLSPSLERKFAPLRQRFELRVLATSADGRAHDDGTFHLVPRLPAADGALFYALLPSRVRALAREHRPDAIVTQSPYEAALVRLARPGRSGGSSAAARAGRSSTRSCASSRRRRRTRSA